MSDIYQHLGVASIINAAGTITRLSGSLMPPEVVTAMAAASRAFVDMDELHRAAALIGVETMAEATRAFVHMDGSGVYGRFPAGCQPAGAALK